MGFFFNRNRNVFLTVFYEPFLGFDKGVLLIQFDRELDFFYWDFFFTHFREGILKRPGTSYSKSIGYPKNRRIPRILDHLSLFFPGHHGGEVSR